MAEIPTCVYCGAPLEDDVYTCDKCGRKNVNFDRPEGVPRIVRAAAPPTSHVGMGAAGFDLTKHTGAPKKKAAPVRTVKAPVHTAKAPVHTATHTPVHTSPTVKRTARVVAPTPPPPPPRIEPTGKSAAQWIMAILASVIAVICVVIVSVPHFFVGGLHYFGGPDLFKPGGNGGAAFFILSVWITGTVSATRAITAFRSDIEVGAGCGLSALIAFLYFIIMVVNTPSSL